MKNYAISVKLLDRRTVATASSIVEYMFSSLMISIIPALFNLYLYLSCMPVKSTLKFS